jgi:hypothetical protein
MIRTEEKELQKGYQNTKSAEQKGVGRLKVRWIDNVESDL